MSSDITKITTPMLPKENIGNKYKPTTDQAFELTDPSKVHKTREEGRIDDKQRQSQMNLNMGRAMMEPLFKDTIELMRVLQKMVSMVQTGVSVSEALNGDEIHQTLDDLFAPSGELSRLVQEQSEAAVLFKGEAFDALRDIIGKFPENPKLRESVAYILKTFEQGINAEKSIKTILSNCYNLLDYMYTKDREQFNSYLGGLAKMLLPDPGSNVGKSEGENLEAALPPVTQEEALKEAMQRMTRHEGESSVIKEPGEGAVGGPAYLSDQREAARLLKNNLLPLLGEIVNKYHQNSNIRDIVMVVVHNIVRVDQGTPEMLEKAVADLVRDLRQVANMPKDFEQNLLDTLMRARESVDKIPNSTIEKMINIISDTLRSQESTPAEIRQAELLLLSMLQNQNSLMNVLHFVLPMAEPDGSHVMAEIYVDPDNEEKSRKNSEERSVKLFLCFDSERHGSFEMSFLQTGETVNFSLWCPANLVMAIRGQRRSLAEMMAAHGYSMLRFDVEEFREPHSVGEVFPALLRQKVGMDVRI